MKTASSRCTDPMGICYLGARIVMPISIHTANWSSGRGPVRSVGLSTASLLRPLPDTLILRLALRWPLLSLIWSCLVSPIESLHDDNFISGSRLGRERNVDNSLSFFLVINVIFLNFTSV